MATRISRLLKGKKRDGTAAGVVIPLELVGDGYYNAAYTFPLQVGSNSQNVSVQVDTGSSDLWLASSSCTSSSCTSNKPQLYNPSSSSSSVSTGQNFDIQYLSGDVSGLIYVDNIGVGGLVVQNQAFAAANSIENELLSSGFSGVLGFALPGDSIIALDLQSSSSSSSSSSSGAAAGNGNSIIANLFGLSSSGGGDNDNDNDSNLPTSPFIGLTLSRPVAPLTSSLLSIGTHPSSIPLSSGDSFPIDAGGISYTPVMPDTISGTYLQWMGSVIALSVFVDGEEKVVDLSSAGGGGGGGEGVMAVVDSGSPVILMMPSLASGVWDAVGVSPAADGNYYVPCVTPLNMTITFSGIPPIPLHPLDLSAAPDGDSSSNTCTGLIQQNSALGSSSSGSSNGAGSSNTINSVDIVLGVPFLRNLYTVLALEEPNADGSFNPVSSGLSLRNLNPYMGFVPLTNWSDALDEFRTVRVLHGDLGSSSDSNGLGNLNSDDGGANGVSPGLSVLFALLGFAALCAVVFLGWWMYMRRRIRREEEKEKDGDGFVSGAVDAKSKVEELEDGGNEEMDSTMWSRYRHSFEFARKDSATLSEDTLRGSCLGEVMGDSLKVKRRPSKLNLDDADEMLMKIRWTFEDLPPTPGTPGSSWYFDVGAGNGGVGSSSRPSTADLAIPEKAALSSTNKRGTLHPDLRLKGGGYGHSRTSSTSNDLIGGGNKPSPRLEETSQLVPLLVHTPDSPPDSEVGLLTRTLPPDVPSKDQVLSMSSGHGGKAGIEYQLDFEPESGSMAGIGTHSRASKISFRYDPEPYEDYFSMTPKSSSGFVRDFAYGTGGGKSSNVSLVREERVHIVGEAERKSTKTLAGDRNSVGTFGVSSTSGSATPNGPEFRLSELNPPLGLSASDEDSTSSSNRQDGDTCDDEGTSSS